MQNNTPCYHCGLPVSNSFNFSVVVEGQQQPMCCIGCKAACEAILSQGFIDYYQLRKDFSNTRQVTEQDERYLAQFCETEFINDVSVEIENDLHEVSFKILGITCPACCWLVEQRLGKEDNIEGVSLNYTKAVLVVRFDPGVFKLESLAKALLELGFYLQPMGSNEAPSVNINTGVSISTLVISGFGAMQVMMFSLPKYLDVWQEMAADIDYFLAWLSAMITTFVIFFAGTGFFTSALNALKHHRVNMDVPISLAIVVAYSASLYNLFFSVGELYFDSACMLIFLLLISRFVQGRGLKRASNNIFNLYSLVPNGALCFRGDKLSYLKLSEIKVRDRLLVKPGEAVPLDVSLLDNEASITTAHLTGESERVNKSRGDFIPAGSINLHQPINVYVLSVEKDSSLSKMIRLVEWAQGQKPKIATLANQIASYFTFAVCGLAFITLLVGFFFAVENTLARMIAVLVVSCPCALSLATPAVVSAAISAMLGEGVLLKNADALEEMSHFDTLVVDKTGTLTDSKLTCTEVFCYQGYKKEEILNIAAAIESQSEHPIASAFSNTHLEATKVKNHTGLGLSGFVDQVHYSLGSKAFMDSLGIVFTEVSPDKKVVYLAKDAELIGVFILDEKIKPGAKRFIESIQKLNIKILMLSGDHPHRVKAVASRLGILEAHGNTLPDEKMNVVRKLQKNRSVVAMLGDGVNDSPVLACANISIAMASGADLAKQKSDLVFLNSDFSHLERAVRIAKKAKRILLQNMIWAGTYNFTAIPFAMAGFITPWMAAVGMSVSSLFVVLNALRVKRL